MKKPVTILAVILFSASLFAQSPPQKISYQAIIRNSSNALVTSSSVGMQISILQASPIGTTPVYVETQTPTTNVNGLVSIEVGAGTIISGTFSAISWANGPFYIKTETDPTGGSNYTITGTSQLLSVPYAFYAKTAGNLTGNKMPPFLTINFIIALQGSFPSDGGGDPGTTLIGEIKMFAGNFAPAGWAFCDGQLLPIAQNTALFSVLGTTYGGNGTTNFMLPDLRGRVSIHKGQGTGLTNRPLGSSGGSE